MDTEFIRKQLIHAARAQMPSDKVPYAFSKRIMANLTMQKPFDLWNLWSRILWKSAASCVGITVFCGAWAIFHIETSHDEIFGNDLEEVMLSALEINGDIW